MYVQPNIGTPLKQPIITAEDSDRRMNKRPEVWIGLAKNDNEKRMKPLINKL